MDIINSQIWNKMKTQADLKQLLKKGHISDEMELERAYILDRKLRLSLKENPLLAEDRKNLRRIIKEYEKINWGKTSVISDERIIESDSAESLAEQERLFLAKRKELIKRKISQLGLTQQDLGKLLGHSKSYISELMNGINPFGIKDLIIIHRLFHIELEHLIPTIISQKEKLKIEESIEKMKNPKLKLAKDDLLLKIA